MTSKLLLNQQPEPAFSMYFELLVEVPSYLNCTDMQNIQGVHTNISIYDKYFIRYDEEEVNKDAKHTEKVKEVQGGKSLERRS